MDHRDETSDSSIPTAKVTNGNKLTSLARSIEDTTLDGGTFKLAFPASGAAFPSNGGPTHLMVFGGDKAKRLRYPFPLKEDRR